ILAGALLEFFSGSRGFGLRGRFGFLGRFLGRFLGLGCLPGSGRFFSSLGRIAGRGGVAMAAAVIRHVPTAALQMEGAGTDEFTERTAAGRAGFKGLLGKLLPFFQHLPAGDALILVNRHTANLLAQSNYNNPLPELIRENSRAPGFFGSGGAPGPLPGPVPLRKPRRAPETG